jgi:RNA polymerase sigma-70 factor (ECF subfamily)
MGIDGQTDMGGVQQAFLTTHWSLIEGSRSPHQDNDGALTGLLLQRYWKPVYCYLRRKGYHNEEAKDLTQDFFHEVVLGHHLIDKADPAKGRFRSFLLMALTRYLINRHGEETAQKRIPKDKLTSFDMTDEPPEAYYSASTLTPEDSFNHAWVSALLDRVLAEVESSCHEDGKSVHWDLFNERILEPIMKAIDPPSMEDLCHKYGIAGKIKASNMIVTVKRRLQAVFREHLRESVMTEESLSGELAEIKRFLPELAQYR